MSPALAAIAERLFAGVAAPLVLGGALRPGRAIGAKAALALGDARISDTELALRVRAGRVRRARRLAPVDSLAEAQGADWALFAAFHDLLQSVNPSLDVALRRSVATRILEMAEATIERVPRPANVSEALSRHAWLARALDVSRADTTVSWWLGSRTFLGIEPPRRLQAWPELRRVSVVRTPHALLELTPIAIDRARLEATVARWLSRTPLTDLATCTRSVPAFTWHDAALALVAGPVGRTLALRALALLPTEEVDAALGRATRELSARGPSSRAWPALTLLAERASSLALGHLAAPEGPPSADASFARALGVEVMLSQRAQR
jgi:hypothetical protein